MSRKKRGKRGTISKHSHIHPLGRKSSIGEKKHSIVTKHGKRITKSRKR